MQVIESGKLWAMTKTSNERNDWLTAEQLQKYDESPENNAVFNKSKYNVLMPLI